MAFSCNAQKCLRFPDIISIENILTAPKEKPNVLPHQSSLLRVMRSKARPMHLSQGDLVQFFIDMMRVLYDQFNTK